MRIMGAQPMNDHEASLQIDRHARLIQRIAYAYGRDRADREDIAQEIAIQLWRSRAGFDPALRETTWVYRIALNVAISFLRRERRHRERRADVDPQVLALGEADRPDEAVERMLQLIAGMNPYERALLLLVFDGNDHATISSVLGISVSNVGTRLARIKDKLRRSLTRADPAEERHGTR